MRLLYRNSTGEIWTLNEFIQNFNLVSLIVFIFELKSIHFRHYSLAISTKFPILSGISLTPRIGLPCWIGILKILWIFFLKHFTRIDQMLFLYSLHHIWQSFQIVLWFYMAFKIIIDSTSFLFDNLFLHCLRNRIDRIVVAFKYDKKALTVD